MQLLMTKIQLRQRYGIVTKATSYRKEPYKVLNATSHRKATNAVSYR